MTTTFRRLAIARKFRERTDLEELREKQRTLADRARIARLTVITKANAAAKPPPAVEAAPAPPVAMTLEQALQRGYAVRQGDAVRCMRCFRAGQPDGLLARPGGVLACLCGHLILAT